MKFLSNPGNPLKRCFCLLMALPLLLHYQQAIGQNPPDSVLERLNISIQKTDSQATKIKDVQRLTFLYLNGFTTPEQRRFYFQYRDSAYSKVLNDTLIKADVRKKLAVLFDSTKTPPTLNFAMALDQLIPPRDTVLAKLKADHNILIREKESLQSRITIRNYILGTILLVLLITTFLLWNKSRKQIRNEGNKKKQPDTIDDSEPSKAGTNKKLKKISEELEKAKMELTSSLEQNNKLQYEKSALEKDKTTLTTSLNEIQEKHKAITDTLAKTETERKKHEDLAAKLEEEVNKLSAIKKEQEEETKKMKEILAKLETSFPSATLPDINSTLHAWFLLQEFIKGYKNKEFSVLSTPNFSRWVLKEDHTYPELDITNLAGNAPIINFLIDLKKRKITSIAPDGSYMILINQKITQQIFDSLKTGE